MDSEVMDPDRAPDSWEMVDLEASMKKLLSASDLQHQISSFVPSSSSSSPSSFSSASVSVSSLVSTSSLSAAASTSVNTLSASDAPSGSAEDVDGFLREALQGKDRLTILRLEQEVIKFMRNPNVQQLEFQPMPSSYLRLAAHRVVQHYNLQSLVADSSNPDNTRIIAKKTSESRFPKVKLVDIPSISSGDDNRTHSANMKIELKRRSSRSKLNRDGNSAVDSSSKLNPAKTVEERKEEYNRARARIFNNSDFGARNDEELYAPESDSYSDSSVRYEKRTEQSSTEFNNGPPKVANGRSERESTVSYKGNNRVAIFRDREKDKKDPDYNRNYDRYVQRFDPGFGMNQGPYGIQPMYAPMVNYNTEFPQLGGGIRPQICVEQNVHRAIPPPRPVRGPWSGNPTSMNFTHPDSMMSSFSSGVYMHPQQFARPAPTMMAVNNNQERFPPSLLQQQQQKQQPHLQPEGSFGQARHQ